MYFDEPCKHPVKHIHKCRTATLQNICLASINIGKQFSKGSVTSYTPTIRYIGVPDPYQHLETSVFCYILVILVSIECISLEFYLFFS